MKAKLQGARSALESGSAAAALNFVVAESKAAAALPHFHEKVGNVKNSPTWRADLYSPEPRARRMLLDRFLNTPPFHLSPLPLFQAAKKSPKWPWDFFAAW